MIGCTHYAGNAVKNGTQNGHVLFVQPSEDSTVAVAVAVVAVAVVVAAAVVAVVVSCDSFCLFLFVLFVLFKITGAFK